MKSTRENEAVYTLADYGFVIGTNYRKSVWICRETSVAMHLNIFNTRLNDKLLHNV